MAWTTQSYTTLADVKLALDPFLSTTDDAFISSLILQAQADIDREVGYPFQQDGAVGNWTTRYFDGTGKNQLMIDDLIQLSSTSSGAVMETYTPISVSSNGVFQVGTTTTTDITADVVLKPNNTIPAFILQRRSGLLFEEGLQNYSIMGIFGQPILPGQQYPGVPNDIWRATTRLVTHYYKMRDTNYADTIQGQGGIREKYSKTMPVDVVEVVERYKKRWFIGEWH
jgi:hypothetical protein